ncbi:MAG: M48 family metallopeptidase [Bacteroidota bacterium]
MKKAQKTLLDIDGRQVPARIYREWRKNVRASIGKTEAILRLPHGIGPEEEQRFFQWFHNYVRDQVANNPEIESRFFGRGYHNGDLLQVGARQYRLRLLYTKRKNHRAQLRNSVITLELADSDLETHRQKAIKHLLSRTVGKDFLPEITRRVMELNELHFRQPINSVRLKYNSSNWGSCSSASNLNLSTRLLFAPQPVIDYVIIHELAHLIELNHSSRFWKLVETAMPNYRDMERWLKENGPQCDF